MFTPYYPPHVGGVEAYSAELAAELMETGAATAVLVLAPRLPASAPESETCAGVDVIRYPAFDAIPNFPVPSVWSPAFWRALGRAWRFRPTLVVSHTRFFVSTLVAMALGRSRRVPWLHVEHGSDFVQLERRWASTAARGYDRTLGRWTLRRADRCVAVSEASRGFVRGLAGRDATVIYRGVRPSVLAVTASAELIRLASGRIAILYVGRLIDGKGVRDLIDALAGLDRRDFFCAIVGDGPRRDDLLASINRGGLADSVALLGVRSENEVVAMIKAADVVVNPSYTEGLPTAVLLAALCGRAVVATDVGGTPEIVSHNRTGLLVGPRRPDELRAALERLLDDGGLRRRLGAAAQDGAAPRFDWNGSIEAFRSAARPRG